MCICPLAAATCSWSDQGVHGDSNTAAADSGRRLGGAASRASAAGSLDSQAVAAHMDTLAEGNLQVAVGNGEDVVEGGVAVGNVLGNHTHVVVVRSHEVVDRHNQLPADKGLTWIRCCSCAGCDLRLQRPKAELSAVLAKASFSSTARRAPATSRRTVQAVCAALLGATSKDCWRRGSRGG